MNPFVQLLIAQLPSLIDAVKKAHAAKDPNAPQPTSEEVLAAFEQLFLDSDAKDEALRAVLKAEIEG